MSEHATGRPCNGTEELARGARKSGVIALSWPRSAVKGMVSPNRDGIAPLFYHAGYGSSLLLLEICATLARLSFIVCCLFFVPNFFLCSLRTLTEEMKKGE